jgi:predicted DNA-binding protein
MDNKSYKLQTHITAEMKEKLDALCAKTGESMASIIRRALVKLLESESNG